jgi:HPt (histidine-containing phosphotransfer) domain-containing protein
MTAGRESQVTQAFVSLANSLVDGFDVVDLLSGLSADCARLLDIASAGVLLADRRRVLHVVAASSEATRNLELFQLQRDQGPCLDCYRYGAPVSVPDLSEHAERWPHFVEAAVAAGFASVHAVPMRLQDNVLGTLGLFGRRVGALTEEDLNLAQALAHVGSVAIVQGTAVADTAAIAEQLQNALRSRMVLEQAKGLIAQLGDLDMDQAFRVLRGYARDRNQRLADTARAVVSRELPAQRLLQHAQSKATRTPRPSAGQAPS